MVTALGIGGKLGALALMLHMTFHTVAKSLLFLCAGNVYQHFKTDLFDKVKGGVIRVMPVTGTVFLIAMLAIVGMPPFSLFQSEFLIVQAAFYSEHYWPTVLFILFGTGIFAGALLHIGGLVLGPGDGQPVTRLHPWRDLSMLALAAILAIIGFWLPAPLLELIRGAARVVTGD
jgi:hydrogenase-4 component F